MSKENPTNLGTISLRGKSHDFTYPEKPIIDINSSFPLETTSSESACLVPIPFRHAAMSTKIQHNPKGAFIFLTYDHDLTTKINNKSTDIVPYGWALFIPNNINPKKLKKYNIPSNVLDLNCHQIVTYNEVSVNITL